MGLFSKNNGSAEPANERQLLESKYAAARSNLLLVMAFTVINIVLLVTNSNSYFLFSAYIPYMFADLGMYLCGRYPAEYYGADISVTADDVFLGNSFFVLMLVVAAFILFLYLLCWIFSKKHGAGWLIAALVFFGIDTLGMLYMVEFSTDTVIDILFHLWVIFCLVAGIRAASALKKLPPEEEAPVIPETDFREAGPEPEPYLYEESAPIRAAEPDVGRVLAETEAEGHTIVYRRVKKTNELVVDGNVYGEYEATFELEHWLTANVGGTVIVAGYDGAVHSYIKVNGETVAKKMRIV